MRRLTTGRNARRLAMTEMAPIDPLRVQIAELSLIKALPKHGPTESVEVVGRTADGREVILSIQARKLETLIKALVSTVRS